MKGKNRGGRHWYVNSQGQTLAIVEGPVAFRMGSPAAEPGRFGFESPNQQVIPRHFAIADTEVTVEQYQEFAKENPGADRADNDYRSPDPSGPMNGVSWYHAAAYCNWLSRKEHLPECYEPNEQGQYAQGMRIKADALKLAGYRLPTEAEWEYAARAGATTSRHYGLAERLLGRVRLVSGKQQRTEPGRSGACCPTTWACSTCWGTCMSGARNRTTKRALKIYINLNTITEEPRLLRGGAFLNPPAYVRSAFRARNRPVEP